MQFTSNLNDANYSWLKIFIHNFLIEKSFFQHLCIYSISLLQMCEMVAKKQTKKQTKERKNVTVSLFNVLKTSLCSVSVKMRTLRPCEPSEVSSETNHFQCRKKKKKRQQNLRAAEADGSLCRAQLWLSVVNMFPSLSSLKEKVNTQNILLFQA